MLGKADAAGQDTVDVTPSSGHKGPQPTVTHWHITHNEVQTYRVNVRFPGELTESLKDPD